MEAKPIDAAEFREKQRDTWNDAASGWKRWSAFIDKFSGAVSERLVQMADVKPGDRVLDVAAGYGEPSLTAARKAGAEGSVVATDISAEMLAFGRERAAAQGLENIEFVQSAAISLEYPADSFDAAVSRWGIIFEPDAEGTATHVRGSLKPGGRFAISSWGPPERVPYLAIPMRTTMERLDVPPSPPGTPGPLSRPTYEALGGLLESGGFTGVEVEELEVDVEWDSPEEFTTFTSAIHAPVIAMVGQQPEDVQSEVWAAIIDAIRDAAGDGPVRFSNLVLLAAGQA